MEKFLQTLALTLSTIALVIAASGVQAQVKSLCESDHEVIFSCTLDHKKMVSLCAKNQRQLMSYFYGKPGQIELHYPSKETRASEVFEYALYFRYQTEYLWINFKNKNFHYSIGRFYSGEENPEKPTITHSLAVNESLTGKNMTEHSCVTVHKDVLSELKNILPQCDQSQSIDCKP